MYHIAVYGFGSAFKDSNAATDVDLLIIHQGTDDKSCRLAIHCKNLLAAQVDKSHITILSADEENYFQFIKSAQAMFLGIIREDSVVGDVSLLCDSHQQLQAP